MRCKYCGFEIIKFEDGPMFLELYGVMEYYHIGRGNGFCQDSKGNFLKGFGTPLLPAQRNEADVVSEILNQYERKTRRNKST